MTLVARFNLQNQVPVVVGDMLVSTPCAAGLVKSLPTFAETAGMFPKEAEDFPSGLEQKVVIIGDNLVIGWAGFVDDAKSAITHLYHVEQAGDLNFDYLDNYLRHAGERAGFVGFLRDGPGFHSFGYRYQFANTQNLGKLGLLGTGTTKVAARLKQFENLPLPEAIKPAGKQPTLGDRAASIAISTAGTLLLEEIATAESLRNAFGGGYEIATLQPSGFRKIDSVTYAFWRGRVVSETEARLSHVPIHICTYGYSGDVLTIRSLSTEGGCKHWFAHVPPLYRALAADERAGLRLPELNSKWLCNFIWVECPAGYRGSLHVNCRSTDRRRRMYLDELAEGLGMGIEQSFVQQLTLDMLNGYRTELGLTSLTVLPPTPAAPSASS
jgi:hypothetical protein